MAQVPTSHSLACPECGGQLQVVALDAQTAPWLCPGCGLGFFACELTSDSRARWGQRTFTRGAHEAALVEAREAELDEARFRGTSLREDQFVHAEVGLLERVAGHRGVEPGFARTILTHLQNVGGE